MLHPWIALVPLVLAGTQQSPASIQSRENLRMLNLSGTPVTDTGLVHLKGLKSLERLMLDYTKVTPAGVAKLRKALPDAKITARGQYRGKE